jgi:hypothetical protein
MHKGAAFERLGGGEWLAQCEHPEAALRDAVVDWRCYRAVLGLQAMRSVFTPRTLRPFMNSRNPISSDTGSHISQSIS